jgi:hypothetical protein
MADHAPYPYDRRPLTFGALWRTVVIASLAWVVGGSLDGADLHELIAVPLVMAAWVFGIFILDHWVMMRVDRK